MPDPAIFIIIISAGGSVVVCQTLPQTSCLVGILLLLQFFGTVAEYQFFNFSQVQGQRLNARTHFSIVHSSNAKKAIFMMICKSALLLK